MTTEVITVIKSQFTAPNVDGDFGFMITQLQHTETLFVFNDNEEQFLSHFLDKNNPNGAAHLGIDSLPDNPGHDCCTAGGGNAVIRPYQCAPHIRAAGVPTGDYRQDSPHYMGYSSLNSHVTRMIDVSIMQIDALLASGRFTSLAFSWSPKTMLGGRIFNTAQEVRTYIVQELLAVTAKH